MDSKTISRKDLLRGAGAAGVMLTVPALTASCGPGGGRLAGQGGEDPIENARAAGLSSPVMIALNCGITAPNSHNTQAWKFLVRGDREFDLFVDETRILPYTDPPARQIHVGQGTFLEHMSIGARELGYRADITLFPEGTYGLYETGKKPVARVKLQKAPGLAKDPLYKEIVNRATNRTDYHGPMITAGEFQRLREAVGPTHAALELMNDPEGMKPFTELFFEAIAIETRTVKRADESRIWFRGSDEDIYSKRDGISLRGNGMSGLKLWIVSTFFLSLEKEAFHAPETQDAFLEPFHETLKTSKAYLFFRTAANTQADWVRTGRDYARVQLALTGMGLVMHPLSQVLQEYPEMDETRATFEERIGQKPGEKIQMLVRIGRSDYSYFAPRRPVTDLVVKG